MNEVITQFTLIKMLKEHPEDEYERGRNSVLIKLLKDSTGLGTEIVEPTNSSIDSNDNNITNISDVYTFSLKLRKIASEFIDTSPLDKLNLFQFNKLYIAKDTNRLLFIKRFNEYTSCSLNEAKNILDKLIEEEEDNSLPF